ncbi:NIPSNAP family protein [Xanthomonas cassavae CFBP 4642]|uniref:NIPSNAP family protein n=2 Tax=Xanthomonas cassavae TaxID=56450 RepID=A0ABS8HF82_9XANT|nr:NIPSNAP family protein [Xanthomonas cassavae]MCC4619327.1 NIPSNAP family protein [Xanthomonas cassavae CFBP 4642]
MITCSLRHVIDPYQLAEFEYDARLWIPLVARFGGRHHGYFLPSEGANNIALALFSFPSLAEYARYRDASLHAWRRSPMRSERVASSVTNAASFVRCSDRRVARPLPGPRCNYGLRKPTRSSALSGLPRAW